MGEVVSITKDIMVVKPDPARPRETYKNLYLHSDFFKEEVIMSVSSEKIMFTHPSLDYKGKTMKPTSSAKESFCIHHVGDLPDGVYPFDPEETNEDQVVIYLEDIIV